jgi:hypothetical protein
VRASGSICVARAPYRSVTPVAPPSRRPKLDIGKTDLVGEQRRQQHAIVGKPRLVADDANRVATERADRELFNESSRCHAVADNDKRLAHRIPQSATCAAKPLNLPDASTASADHLAEFQSGVSIYVPRRATMRGTALSQ